MEHLIPLKRSELNTLLNKRSKETKFGEQVKLLTSSKDIYEELQNLDVTYVVFGIKDDVGVFANYGNPGTSGAWEYALNNLINIQSNSMTYAKKVLILGSLDFKAFNQKLKKLDQQNKSDIKKARNMVSKIDGEVSHLVSQIVSSGKVPIIIGGGHNNAYGAIKGSALALNQPINAVNFDAHHDFRAEEGRHSGNGFSYAYAEGFLKKYFVFGLHENYISERIYKTINKIKGVKFCTYEEIAVRKDLKFKAALNKAIAHVSNNPFGIEIDCDAIENVPSSAKTPSGFIAHEARQFLHSIASSHENVTYLHICEAAPLKNDSSRVGKVICYLISDFIRAHEESLRSN